MNAIEPDGAGGIRIGALVTLHEIATNAGIRERHTAIADAGGEAATPQIRNLATVGGNLVQRPRCWYFRNPEVYCLKKGGDTCYAIKGLNRYHAILGGGPSYIVHPSNLAPALIAFSASIKLVGPGGERTVDLEQFFALPKADPTRENVLRPGEILTEVVIPASARGSRSVYLEAREKKSFDWPLVSVAAVVTTDKSETVRSARVVMGAVAPVPWRSPEAEAALKGGPLDESRARSAAAARAERRAADVRQRLQGGDREGDRAPRDHAHRRPGGRLRCRRRRPSSARCCAPRPRTTARPTASACSSPTIRPRATPV